MDPIRDGSTQAASSSTEPVPGPDSESSVAEAATSPTATWPRIPAVGDSVVFRGHPARVITVHSPGDADAEVDLVVFHGAAPEVSARIPHESQAGWCWPSELPPAPPTLAEKLNAAIKAGIKVPAIGQTVLLIEKGLDLPGEKPFFAQRAKVTAITGIHGDQVTVNLDVFTSPEPPEDSREADPLTWNPHHQDVVGPVTAKGGWAWPGWVCPPRGPNAVATLPCTRCQARVPISKSVEIHASAHFGPWDFHNVQGSKPVARLCEACADLVFNTATVFAPEPAVVLPGGPAQRQT